MKLIWLVLTILLICIPARCDSEDVIMATPTYTISRVDMYTIKFKGNMEEGAGMYLVMAAAGIEAKTVILDSPGGLMYEAAIIASYLEETGVAVVIEKDTMCISACAFAAMRSENLIINGKMVFHPPYFPVVSTNDSLYSIIHTSNILTLDLAKWFLDAGYSLSLLKLIYDDTDNQKFMVFDSYEALSKFKSTDILYLPEDFSNYYDIVQGETLFK